MNDKLEKLLSEYKKEHQITNDKELSDALNHLLSIETERPAKEMDTDLIDEIVDRILILDGVDMVEFEKHAKKSLEKTLQMLKENDSVQTPKLKKAKNIGRKWIMPFAAVLSIMMITTVVTLGFGSDIASMSASFFKELKENVLYKNPDNDFIIADDFTEYSSFEEFLKDDISDNILLPYGLFERTDIDNIQISDFGAFHHILITFQMNGKEQSLIIDIPRQSSYDFSDKTTKINGFDVYHYAYEDLYQGLLVYENNLYTITTSSYATLEEIILNLEVSNEKND